VAKKGFGAALVFLVVGIGLLLGAAYAYDLIVRQPRTWPQTDALVVSSRVVNPRGPAHYSPELVFRLEEVGGARDVRVSPSWSSSSFNVVQSHVGRFPPGVRVKVAVNPADASDVRYDLTLSVENLLVTGVLGLMGAVFAGIGLIAGRAGSPRGMHWSASLSRDAPRMTKEANRVARRIGIAFVGIGAVIAAIGAFMVRADVAMLRTWPRIEARVLQSRVVPAAVSSSNRRGASRASYDTAVTFRYVVNDVTIESTTAYSGGTSHANAEARMRTYAPGTVHPVWYRPEDPRLVRFDLGSGFAVFFLSGGLLIMGGVFIGLGGLVWRLARAPVNSQEATASSE
jgi:hypothetical protein